MEMYFDNTLIFLTARKYASLVFIISSLVNKMINDFFLSSSLLSLVVSEFVFMNLMICSVSFYKLCKILADHDQCIQWSKEHNPPVSSVMCLWENCSNTLSWT